MLAAVLGGGAHLAPLKDLIIETTGGTPFWMEETVQALFDEGVDRNGEGKRRAAPAALFTSHPTDGADDTLPLASTA